MKISELLTPQTIHGGFPMIGRDGYAGEIDGTRVLLSGPHSFASRESADSEFPNGVPEYVRVHWCTYAPGEGWQAVFGWWSDKPNEGDGNPLRAD